MTSDSSRILPGFYVFLMAPHRRGLIPLSFTDGLKPRAVVELINEIQNDGNCGAGTRSGFSRIIPVFRSSIPEEYSRRA